MFVVLIIKSVFSTFNFLGNPISIVRCTNSYSANSKMSIECIKRTIATPNIDVATTTKFSATPTGFTASKNSQYHTLKSTVGTGKSRVTRPSGRFSNYFWRFCRFSSTVTTPVRG